MRDIYKDNEDFLAGFESFVPKDESGSEETQEVDK